MLHHPTHLLALLPLLAACGALPELEAGSVAEPALSLAPDADMGGCSSQSCGGGGGGAESDAANAATNCPAPQEKDHGRATNIGNSCVPVAKINADIAAGLPFIGNPSPDLAAGVLAMCLNIEGCMSPEGFGPPLRLRHDEAAWDYCFAALCECNELLTGENLACDVMRLRGGNTPGSCNAPGSVAIFRSRRGGHAVTVERTTVGDDGSTTFEVRDPNAPDDTDPVIVDGDGRVDESLCDGVWDGDRLIGCFTFRRAG